MRDVTVYDDGKIRRPIKATIIKTNSKRHFIRFYDFMIKSEIEAWFKKVKKSGGGVYTHEDTNTWFYEVREGKKFKEEMKDYLI